MVTGRKREAIMSSCRGQSFQSLYLSINTDIAIRDNTPILTLRIRSQDSRFGLVQRRFEIVGIRV